MEDPSASIEYTTRLAKFQSVASLTLHFPSNGGGDCTRIHFVGLRGEARDAGGVCCCPKRRSADNCLPCRAGKRARARGAATHRVRSRRAAARPPGARAGGAVAHATRQQPRPITMTQQHNTRRCITATCQSMRVPSARVRPCAAPAARGGCRRTRTPPPPRGRPPPATQGCVRSARATVQHLAAVRTPSTPRCAMSATAGGKVMEPAVAASWMSACTLPSGVT